MGRDVDGTNDSAEVRSRLWDGEAWLKGVDCGMGKPADDTAEDCMESTTSTESEEDAYLYVLVATSLALCAFNIGCLPSTMSLEVWPTDTVFLRCCVGI